MKHTSLLRTLGLFSAALLLQQHIAFGLATQSLGSPDMQQHLGSQLQNVEKQDLAKKEGASQTSLPALRKTKTFDANKGHAPNLKALRHDALLTQIRSQDPGIKFVLNDPIVANISETERTKGNIIATHRVERSGSTVTITPILSETLYNLPSDQYESAMMVLSLMETLEALLEYSKGFADTIPTAQTDAADAQKHYAQIQMEVLIHLVKQLPAAFEDLSNLVTTIDKNKATYLGDATGNAEAYTALDAYKKAVVWLETNRDLITGLRVDSNTVAEGNLRTLVAALKAAGADGVANFEAALTQMVTAYSA